MATRYFKKFGPNTQPVYNGRKIPFPTMDGLVGFRATDDPAEAVFYIQCMQQQRYGLTEITAQEYEDSFQKKKAAGPATRGRIWSREELGTGSYQQGGVSVLGEAAVRAATAISGVSDIPEGHVPATLPFGAQTRTDEADAPPNLGKRKSSG